MRLPKFEDLPKKNQDALRNEKNLTNLEKACYLLGWQGGTIHQVAKETGLTINQIMESKDIETLMKEKMKIATIVEELDSLATEIESQDNHIALAIDLISDKLSMFMPRDNLKS
jgi:hypothetical protein